MAVTAALFRIAPTWESVSKDDDVGFFPAGYPSVIGQDRCSSADFPKDVASSQAVVVVERPDGKLASGRLRNTSCPLVQTPEPAEGRRAQARDQAGDRLPPVAGDRRPRLDSEPGHAHRRRPGQASLVLVSLNGTYIAKQTRIAMDRLQEVLAAFREAARGPER